VRWLGSRHLATPAEADWPIRIRQNAFADGKPTRDLYRSRDHAVFAEGVLIPVRALLNNDTVAPVNIGAVTYHHVLLDRHDIVLAEGLACETLLDCETGAAFDNADTAPHHAIFLSASAPIVTQGQQVDRARQTLQRRSVAGISEMAEG
jgi:hypothetical protein